MRRTAGAAAIAMLILGTAAAGVAHEKRDAAAEFDRGLDAYLQLRRQATRQAPSPRITSDPEEIVAVRDAIANAIRAVRPRAKTGNIFTGEVAAVLRRRIKDALRQHSYDVADLLAEITREAPRESANLAVNARFDWRFGSQMPALIIAALPAMPSDILQYRFVGRDLVILDIGADLIVDVMPAALPAS